MKKDINNRLGIIWILMSVSFASVMSILVKELGQTFDSRSLVLFRAGLLTIFLCLPVVAIPAFRRRLYFSKPYLHIFRGLLIAFSTHLGFFTLTVLPIATTVVLFFTAPIFATILSIFINKERVGLRRWLAVIIGFFGVLIVLQPGFEGSYTAMFAALLSSFLFALALAFSRNIVSADGSLSAYISSVLITFVISLPLAHPVLENIEVHLSFYITIVLILFLAITSFLRGIGDIQAYHYGEAAVLAPFTYLRLIIVGTFGYFIWGEMPDNFTLLGAFIIICAAIYIGQREARVKSKPLR
jgi:drug/metabolite transporter (DMT)-like permease